MRKKEVLKRIIANKGSCDWVMEQSDGSTACQYCPLGKLRQKPNGDYFSCFESICGDIKEDNSSKIDKMYHDAAVNILLDISMDEELGVDEGEYAFEKD